MRTKNKLGTYEGKIIRLDAKPIIKENKPLNVQQNDTNNAWIKNDTKGEKNE